MNELDKSAPNKHTMFIYHQLKSGHNIRTDDLKRNSGLRWVESADFNHHLSYLLQHRFLEQYEGDGRSLTLKKGDNYNEGFEKPEDLKGFVESTVAKSSSEQKEENWK